MSLLSCLGFPVFIKLLGIKMPYLNHIFQDWKYHIWVYWPLRSFYFYVLIPLKNVWRYWIEWPILSYSVFLIITPLLLFFSRWKSSPRLASNDSLNWFQLMAEQFNHGDIYKNCWRKLKWHARLFYPRIHYSIDANKCSENLPPLREGQGPQITLIHNLVALFQWLRFSRRTMNYFWTLGDKGKKT